MSKKPRAYLKRCFPPEPKVERYCLSCDRKFLAAGRFNRICPTCKNIHQTSYSTDITGGRWVIC